MVVEERLESSIPMGSVTVSSAATSFSGVASARLDLEAMISNLPIESNAVPAMEMMTGDPFAKVGVDLDVEERVGDQPIETNTGPNAEVMIVDLPIKANVGLDLEVRVSDQLVVVNAGLDVKARVGGQPTFREGTFIPSTCRRSPFQCRAGLGC